MTGYLTVIFGPMFAGKSGTMFEKVAELMALYGNTIQTLIVSPQIDTRGGDQIVSSHSLLFKGLPKNLQVMSVDRLEDIDDNKTHYDVIGVDECQFFASLDHVKTWVKQGKHVICAGLISDFKMEKFGSLIDLIPMADQIIHLRAKCLKCRDERMTTPSEVPFASFTKRLIKSDETVVVGGSNEYIPVCRQHHQD